MQKIVKLQILGMKGDNKNLTLSKDLTIANAIDGHFETDRETAAMLKAKMNVKDQPKMLAEEGEPEYTAPAPVVAEVKQDNINDLKDDLYKAQGTITVLREDIENLQKDLEKAQSTTPLSKDATAKKLQAEIDELKETVKMYTDENKALQAKLTESKESIPAA